MTVRKVAPKRIYGGTCFFLQFASGIVGVTANHVIEALHKAVSDNYNTVCQFGPRSR